MDQDKTIRCRLNQIRSPEEKSGIRKAGSAAAALAAGILLGLFSKWLDNLALDGTVWWHRSIEALDLGNFFSDIAIWLLLALVIAVFSCSALHAACSVFAFFAGMCAAYHVYTVLVSGFNPGSYMMIWYGITILSPLLAVLCWYAKGRGPIPVLIDIGTLAVFFLSCFSIGLFYLDFRGILYGIVFLLSVLILYRDPKQITVSLAAGLLLAFPASRLWPYL